MPKNWHKNTHPALRAHWNTLWHRHLVSIDETLDNCCKQLPICEGLTGGKNFFLFCIEEIFVPLCIPSLNPNKFRLKYASARSLN